MGPGLVGGSPESETIAAEYWTLSFEDSQGSHCRSSFFPVPSGMGDMASVNLVVTKEQVIVYIQPHTYKNFQITLT